MPAQLSGGPIAEDFSRARKMFLHKTAKSVTEIQSNVNNLADVLVFLEVLGYDANKAKAYGFSDLLDLARHVFEIIDYYNPEARGGELAAPLISNIPGLRRRLLGGLLLMTPWLMMVSTIFVFGVSLWLDWHLPVADMTSMALGIMLGMLVGEGPIWVFNRLFIFYHSQENVSETRRVMKRSYAMLAVMLSFGATALYVMGWLFGVPVWLVTIATMGMVTVSFHRLSFVPVYALKKVRLATLSYVAALTLLILVYFFSVDLLPNPTTRYLVSLGAAFVVLSVPAVYCNRLAISERLEAKSTADWPPFYRPSYANSNTLPSRFIVQLWENLPYFLYGSFYFAMLFGDRIISWLYNPVHTVGGVTMPLVFNAIYHMGADIGLFVVVPVGFIQYVMGAHIFGQLKNISLQYTSTEENAVDDFIRARFKKMLLVALATSLSIAVSLEIAAPSLIASINGTATSTSILQTAVLGNILLVLFISNSFFIMLLNRAKQLTLIALVSASIVTFGGLALGSLGYQYIVLAYVASCASGAFLSTRYVRSLLRRPARIFYARFT